MLARTSSLEMKAVLHALLTKTEKVMLAKRLAIIYMLENGESWYRIQHTLKVSPSTVERLSHACDLGIYDALRKKIGAKRWNGFWRTMEALLPPRAGRDRFKNFLKF